MADDLPQSERECGRCDPRKSGDDRRHPRNVLRALGSIVKAANAPQADGTPAAIHVPHLRFHDLRHSAASLLIAQGVELVQVSQLLGHSELRVTADLYSHLQRQTSAKAARLMDAILG